MDQQKNRRSKKTEQSDISSALSSSQEKETKNSSEKIDIGLDISTSVIGVCLLESDSGQLISLSNIKLNSTKFKSLWEKADHADVILRDLKNKTDRTVYRIFVEASAKGFSPGFSSADTLFTLAKFNGIVSYIARNVFSAELIDVNVSSARKQLGIKIDRNNKTLSTKEKVRMQVLQLYPDLPIKKHIAKTGKSKGKEVVDKECEDEIDSFVIARGGQLINK